MDHPELIAVLLRSLAWALVLHGLAGWLIDGAVLATRKGPADERAFFAALAGHARRMVKVGLLGLLLRGVAVGTAVGVWWSLQPLRQAGSFAALAGAVALTAGAGLALQALCGAALDRARGLAVETPTLSTPRALGQALRSLAHRPLRWLVLALAPGAVLLGFALLQSAAAFAGPALAGLVGVTVVVARVFVRLTALDWRNRS
jgi:hypothetical protein